MKEKILVLGVLVFVAFMALGQKTDSVTLQVNTVKSRELLEYYRFERIDYYEMQLKGRGIKDQYFVLTSSEYWNGKMTKTDTIANTMDIGLKNGTDSITIHVMSKKVDSDSIRFQFSLPRFSTYRKFHTTLRDEYSLRDITSNRMETFVASEPINILVYSLPYEDPNRPGFLFYCELSREGIPPEKWGEKFGVEHYIVFKLQLIK